MQPRGDSLGPLALGSRTADFFRNTIQRPWFAHYLHGRGETPGAEVWAFETGANLWRSFDRWPPRESAARRLYLHPGGKLSFEHPGAEPRFDAYTSDPLNPVPYLPRPITDAAWRGWLLADQRFLAGRDDVRSWTSDPLEQDLVIAGDVLAKLVASTTGSDADWVVKLIDVYPDSIPGVVGGIQLMVNADILRGRHARSFSKAAPLRPNQATEFTIDLRQQLYRFRKGHRLMVQVQSSWFPLYDRNPQTFVPNIFHAPASAYQAREHRIWYGGRQTSHLVLPVLPLR